MRFPMMVLLICVGSAISAVSKRLLGEPWGVLVAVVTCIAVALLAPPEAGL